MVCKLVYFGVRGLGEQIRMLLHDNNIPFEDEIVDHKQFLAMKPNLIFGQLPILHDDGIEVAQSGAIMRHLGRKHGLYGESLKDAAFLDMFYDGIKDVNTKYVRLIYIEYDEKKQEFITQYLPGELQKLNKLLGTTKGDWVLGDKKSFVDYYLFEILNILQVLDPHCLETADGKGLQNLQTFWKAMQEKRNLKEFLQSKEHTTRPINGNKNK